MSESQSSGFSALGSGIISGSSSSQELGLVALASGIIAGASSSQSSGFRASGSGIFSRSSQSEGFLSSGSSISFGGFTGGVKSSSKLPSLITLWSSSTLNVLSGWTCNVNKCGSLSLNGSSTRSLGFLQCFSENVPFSGFLWRKIKWSLWSLPHLSGPNIMVYGVLSWNSRRSAVCFPCESSLR